jgi:signal transduction histidine kinase
MTTDANTDATTDANTDATTAALDRSAARPGFYGALWRSVPRELGFLLPSLPVALAGFALTVGFFATGAATIALLLLGIVFLIVALYAARGFGTLELLRLEWAGRPAIPRPAWDDPADRRTFWTWLTSVLGSGHYWLYLLHTMVVNLMVSLVSWTLTVVWLAAAFGGVTSWFWRRTTPGDEEWTFIVDRLLPDDGAQRIANDVISVLIGATLIALLPLLTRALVMLHEVVARYTLGAFASDALRRQVGDLEASRGAAISAEGHSLRRLERDIHDGPQQRLVRLQMDLSAADRQLDRDPAKARQLISEAMQQSKDALEELRALSRGFAPPILLDRGLVAALESAAVRSEVPVRVVSDLPEGFELPREIERNAYFVASEALTNAAKHAGATDVEARVSLRRVADTDDTWLDVSVTDDGRGGATAVDGHGLAGLDERLRGLGGTLEVASPVGGPTVVTAHLPLGLPGSLPGSLAAPGGPGAP